VEPIRVVIVDDEALARERLRRLVEAESDLVVSAMCAGGKEAVRVVTADPPDLLFLDVQMPELDGFGVMEALLLSLPVTRCPLPVFVTAYDQHAVRAFEAQAVDYLVKPFDDERFAATLDRVRRLVRQSRVEAATGKLRALLGDARDTGDTAAPEKSEGMLEHIVLKTGNRSKVVRADAVDWIAADGVYARVHVDRSSYLIRTPMHTLETRLDPKRFVRIHRSTIVNIDRVKEVHEIDRGEYAVVLTDGTKLKLGRSRKAQLESLLGQSL
jgi:two-component system, LytTR family, response regulator